MENTILEIGVKKTAIFRPSILIRTTKESRIMESISVKIMSALKFLFIGTFKKYSPIKTEIVAAAMIRIANSPVPYKIYESDEIEELAT